MKKQDLKTGDEIYFKDGSVGVVLLKTDKGDIIRVFEDINCKFFSLEEVVDDISLWSGTGEVKSVYRPKKSDYLNKNKKGKLLWTREEDIQISITKNGKQIDPSCISEETWLNLRNKS